MSWFHRTRAGSNAARSTLTTHRLADMARARVLDFECEDPACRRGGVECVRELRGSRDSGGGNLGK